MAASVRRAFGTLSDCIGTGITVPSPRGLVVYNDTLYLTGFGSNQLLGCPINPATGELRACANISVTKNGTRPYGLATNGDYLYITYIFSNEIYKCPLVTLSTVPSPCELTSADNLSLPNDLAFDEGFAYITSRGTFENVARCMVNTTTGDLGPGCEVFTYPGLGTPRGTIFPPMG